MPISLPVIIQRMSGSGCYRESVTLIIEEKELARVLSQSVWTSLQERGGPLGLTGPTGPHGEPGA